MVRELAFGGGDSGMPISTSSFERGENFVFHQAEPAEQYL
jgi:hypothetical protein